MATAILSTPQAEAEQSCIQEITQLHNEMAEASRMSLEKAIRIGELLTKQKASMRHGKFGKWVKAKLPFTWQTANNYMNMYQRRADIASKLQTVWNLRDAYALFRKPQKRLGKGRKKKSAKPQPTQHTVPLWFNKAEKEQFKDLVDFLQGKVFDTKSIQATVLAALQFAQEHAKAKEPAHA